MHFFLLHRYKTDLVHYLTPTDDNRLSVRRMIHNGVFREARTDDPNVIAIEVDTARAQKIFANDGNDAVFIARQFGPLETHSTGRAIKPAVRSRAVPRCRTCRERESSREEKRRSTVATDNGLQKPLHPVHQILFAAASAAVYSAVPLAESSRNTQCSTGVNVCCRFPTAHVEGVRDDTSSRLQFGQ